MGDELTSHDAGTPGRTKVVDVPGLGVVEFHMRYRDRRADRGYARIDPNDRVRVGYGVTRGYGVRRTTLVQWRDIDEAVHTMILGPVPGLRGRASPRYRAADAQGWVSL
ncbi:MAG: hypothetical protein ABIQ73_26605 [Acidimicrobiales bacterium]